MNTEDLRKALIHHVIAAHESHRPATLTRIQQTTYLLQEVTRIPTAFRYRIHYGSPNSYQVEHTVSYLKLAGYITTEPHYSPNSLNILLKYADHPHPDWPTTLSPYLESIGHCLAQLKQTDPRRLDMMASAHITHATLSERDPATTSTDVVQTVWKMKPRYDPADITAAYQALPSLVAPYTLTNK